MHYYRSLLGLATSLFSLFFATALRAQPKPLVSFETMAQQAEISALRISKDGRYVHYIIRNQPAGSSTLVVQSTGNKWEKQYPGAADPGFSRDERFVLFKKADGSCWQLELSTLKETTCQLPSPETVHGIRLDHDAKRLHIGGARAVILEQVADYVELPEKNAIVLLLADSTIAWYDLLEGTQRSLWKAPAGAIVSLDRYNKPGSCVLLRLQRPVPPVNPDLVEVDVWGYRDANDPEPYEKRATYISECFAVGEKGVLLIAGSHENIESAANGYALVRFREGNDLRELKWNARARASFYLVSLADGSRKQIVKEGADGFVQCTLSPDADYVVVMKEGEMRYYAYDVATAQLRPVSGRGDITRKIVDLGGAFLPARFCWLPGKAFTVLDDHDIWKLDATGRQAPVNLTAGYGRQQQLMFYMLEHGNQPVKTAAGYVLTAYDPAGKTWGFYAIPDLSGKAPVKLHMGPYFYGGDRPLMEKAASADAYILRRETATETPNYFYTADFKNFTRLSHIDPRKAVNWLTVSPIRWKAPMGRVCDGILYKPENFDSTRKYPVVVTIYNEFSSRMNKCIDLNIGEFGSVNFLPVAWLVSRGYLVFIPDLMHRGPGTRLRNGLDMLESGVEAIKKLPYVDPQRIGLQGASWGGEQVNYVVAHTNIFAAAFSGAGYSEQISGTGFSNALSSNSNIPHMEYHLGGLLTDVPQNYIHESALFAANKVQTPLLLKCNIDDPAVPFHQGLEYFRALRRYGKKVWFLQYDGGGHGVPDGKCRIDMYTRINQFFDHFLRDQSPPVWMTKGIRADRRQKDSGLETDLSAK